MTRLTNPLRDAIVTAALTKAGWSALNEKYHADLRDFAEACRLDALGMPEAELEALIAAADAALKRIPEGLTYGTEVVGRTSEYLNITAGGEKDRVYFENANGMHEDRLSPQRHTFQIDSPLFARREALKAAAVDLASQRETIAAQVRGALSPFNTVAQLLKSWPEAKELIPEHIPEAKPQLPAVKTADLNKLIGLPTK